MLHISHTDSKYYEKMAQVYVKASEAIGQAYIEHYSKDSKTIVSKAALEMNPIEKLELWTKAELDEVVEDQWKLIA